VEVLILDEPTSGLDPLMEGVSRMHSGGAVRRSDRAAVRHILSETERLGDRVSIIKNGHRVETGTMAELRHLTRANVEAVPVGPCPPT
jgi:ABC-2 type transport system ATP-binding protein